MFRALATSLDPDNHENYIYIYGKQHQVAYTAYANVVPHSKEYGFLFVIVYYVSIYSCKQQPAMTDGGNLGFPAPDTSHIR